MAGEVATAYVSLIPSAQGFGRRIGSQIGPDLDRSGRQAGSRFGTGMRGGILPGIAKLGGPLTAAVAALGVGKIVSDSIASEASFSKTIRQIGVAADASAPQVDKLRAYAVQMGSETSFSAGEAADAMLELAKGGISPAVIQGGALKAVMSLAAAGQLELADAANVTSAAMHVFNIDASKSASIADALAGGANASSADVGDLAQALSQAGGGAAAAGLSLNETVGVLAALSDVGITGSDAGTAVKTMLTSLVPSSKEAARAMKDLGLNFLDAKGDFLPISDVADQLHNKLDGLSQSQRTAALQTIFGSDAARAAGALYTLGGKGVDKYIAATEKQGSAQKLADAAMGGTSGALDRLGGAYDTAKLAIGSFLAPATVAVADALGSALGAVATALGRVKLPKINIAELFGGAGGAGGIAGFFAPLTAGIQSFISTVGPALASLGGPLKAFVAAILPTLQALAAQLVGVLGPGLASIGQIISGTFIPAVRAILPVLGPIVAFIIGQLGGALIGVLKGAIQIIQGALTAISGFFNIFAALFTGDWSRLWLGLKQIVSGTFQVILGIVRVVFYSSIVKTFSSGFSAIRGIFSKGLSAIKALWSGGLRVVQAAPGAAWAVIRATFRGGVSAIGSIMRGAASLLGSLMRAGMRALTSAARSGISSAIGVIRGLPGRIVAALGNVSTLLSGAGAALIGGLIAGISSRIGDVGEAIGSVVSKIKAHLPGSPIKEGPLKSWNNGGAGIRLVGLLTDGIRAGTPSTVREVARLTEQMQAAAGVSRMASPKVAGSLTYGANMSTEGGTVIQFKGNVGWDPDEVAKRIERRRAQRVAVAGLAGAR
jgi:TP901 family phage tail tape measure protein